MTKKLLLALLCLCCLLTAGCDALPKLTPDGGASARPEGAASAYLVVTVADAVYEPIPLTETGRYTVTQGDKVNVIEVTEDGVRMAESTCANQDCVNQGKVTLENKDERVLKNMILCLPNDVILELYTYEELLQVMEGWQAQ